MHHTSIPSLLVWAGKCFCILTSSFMTPVKASAEKLTMARAGVLMSCSASATAVPEGENTCGVWAVFWKEPCSLYWWLTENRKTFSKADEVRGLRLFFCDGTITSYLPGRAPLSSPCNCDLSVKTKPLSLTNKGSTFRFTWLHLSGLYRYKSCGLSMWSQC